MSSSTYLAVDIGASSGRHLLGWVENDEIQLREIYRFENRLTRKEGHLLWDIDHLFGHVVEGLRRCAAEGTPPDSMGIDTWGVDFCLLDGNGDRLGDTVSYRDTRTSGMGKWVFERMDESELYRRTGIQRMEINSIYQFAALQKESPELLQQAKHLLMIPDYLNYRLTGIMKQEYTNATTTQLVGAHSREWDMDILDAMGLPRSLFGPLSQPGEKVGCLRPELKQELGFDCEVILPATHDTASAVVATPIADRDRAVFLSSGTWSLIGMERTVPDCSAVSQALNFTNEGGVNGTWRYLKNIMGLWMIQSVRHELNDQYSFQQLSDMAEAESIDSVIDAQDTRLLSPESMTETIRTLCSETDQAVPQTPGQLMRVIALSLAEGYRRAIEGLEQIIGHPLDVIHIVGGGSKDDFINRLTAKATGKKVLAGPSEATAMGNLLVQMLRRGEFEDLAAARAAIRRSKEIRIITE